jgi:recombination protein RecT
MTTQSSQATTQLAVNQSNKEVKKDVKSMSVDELLQNPIMRKQIEIALPKHMTPDRMLRIALTEWRRNPKLHGCNALSYVGAIVQCSQLGLEPGNKLDHVHLIPFGKECQVIMGYRGMLELSRRSEKVMSQTTQAVYELDFFDYEYGSKSFIKHKPHLGHRGDLIAVYSDVKFVNGGEQFEVMSKIEVDQIMLRSKTYRNGPWQTDYEAMARKTVIRRLFKYMPISIEMNQAVQLDEQADLGSQNNALIIESALDSDEAWKDRESPQETTKADQLAERLGE